MKQALACAGLLLMSVPVLARPPGAIRLQLDDCLASQRDEIRRIAGIELHADLDSGDASATQVVARCGPMASAVEISAQDPSGPNARRTVDLRAAAPNAQARLLALTIAEVVSSLVPEPERPPPPPPAVPKPERPARPRTWRLQLSAIGTGHGYFSGVGFVAGGGLRLAQDLPKHVGWSLDVFEEHGAASFTAGTITADLINVDATLFFHREWGRLGLRVGGGVRGGAVRLDGTPAATGVTGATLWGPFVGPMALISFTARPVPRLAVELAVDGGYVVVPVTGLAPAGAAVAVDGGWIGFRLALGTFL